ncbi:MAG: hypothetical protein IH944_01495 [Armatimonadetes bacterium]|nr:hypothetical protein [Armatimonadota bacterium]
MLILRISFLLAVVAAIVTYPVIRHYEGKAQLVQLVEVTEEAALFGEPGELIGSPQRLVIEVPAEAIIEGAGPQGSILVDKAYLDDHGIYPRQLKTITFIGGTVRTASVTAAFVLMAALLLIRWRERAAQRTEFGAT